MVAAMERGFLAATATPLYYRFGGTADVVDSRTSNRNRRYCYKCN